MKRWIHASTKYSSEYDEFHSAKESGGLARVTELPSRYSVAESLYDLRRGDIILVPSAYGAGYYILEVQDRQRAEDSIGRGYNLIEQRKYNRVVAERKGDKVAVYRD